MTQDELKQALLNAYTQSLTDECRMRYITATGQVIKGNQIYNARDSDIIASLHAVRL